jgi:hypothetical protein
VYTGKVKQRLCLVLDCLCAHDFSSCNADLLNLQHYVIREKKLSEKESIVIFYDTVRVVDSLHKVQSVCSEFAELHTCHSVHLPRQWGFVQLKDVDFPKLNMFPYLFNSLSATMVVWCFKSVPTHCFVIVLLNAAVKWIALWLHI